MLKGKWWFKTRVGKSASEATRLKRSRVLAARGRPLSLCLLGSPVTYQRLAKARRIDCARHGKRHSRLSVVCLINHWLKRKACYPSLSNYDVRCLWTQSKTSTAYLSPLRPSHHFSAFSCVVSRPFRAAFSIAILAAASETPLPTAELPQI